MGSSRFQLPSPEAPPESLVSRVRRFLLRTWRGRILLAASVLALLQEVGLPVPVCSSLGVVVLWVYGIVTVLWLLWWTLRKLLWRIRTKLLLSYLFIALVPVVLLTTFFLIAGLLVSGLVASNLVSREVEDRAQDLTRFARSALVGLDLDGPDLEGRLAGRLGPAREIHPDLRFVLVRRGRRLAGDAQLPAELPSWWKGPGFGGLVRTGEGEPEVLRAVWQEGDHHLLIQVPLDQKLFANLEARMGIRLLTVGGRVERRGEDIEVRVPGKETQRIRRGEDVHINGMAFFATPERTDWKTGDKELDPLTFQYDPRELVRRLTPGSLNTADILVKVLAAVGAVFLFMYAFALFVGLLLARSITYSVHALSKGTERLRRGDFSQPIRVRSRDQLGDLAESFNVMARGIQDLLREQAEKERLEEELRIARQIQMSLLPQGTVSVPGLRIAALCLPAAEVGGDYYDLLPLSDTRMAVLVADVSGKGTSAALYMAELKGLVLSLSRIYDSPARLLSEANRILSANMDARSFVTMTYALVDTAAGTMRYARAGHNPILQLEAATGRTRVLTPAGIGLGMDPGQRFDAILEEAEVPLKSGDAFLFFTDGLSEAMNAGAELFGESRLRTLMEQGEALGSEEMKDRILQEIRGFVGDAAQHDDMTLVILRVA